MKKFRKLIPALAMLLVSAVLMSTASYAWFSMNTTVTATGMKVQAKAEGSIVITSTTSLPAAGTVATNLAINDNNATELYASTHSGEYATHATGLKYVTNAGLINPETGVALNSTATLTYADASNTVKTFYKDYTLFIAGDGQDFTDQDIVITLTTTKNSDIDDAISIDFYGEAVTTLKTADVNSTNYKGTLNLAGLDSATNDASTTKTQVTITSVTIPQTGTSKAYAITMRVYYDGALLQTKGTYGYTAYKQGTGTATAGNYYYTTNTGASIATVAANADVSSLYVVDAEASSYAYARTTEVTKISAVTLDVSFQAVPHTNP